VEGELCSRPRSSPRITGLSSFMARLLENQGGRKSSLTPEVHARIVESLRLGNYKETAAAEAGVSSRTLRRWYGRGAKGEEPYAGFLADSLAAEAEAESRDVKRLADHGRDDWRAAAWRLERKHPDRWGLHLKVEIRQELEKIIDVAERVLEPDAFTSLLNALNDSAGEIGQATESEVIGELVEDSATGSVTT